VATDPLDPFRADPGSSAVLLDVDGVLAPIVLRPELSEVPASTLDDHTPTEIAVRGAGGNLELVHFQDPS